MRLQKLPWAGILLQTKQMSFLIDPLGNPATSDRSAGQTLLGTPREPIVPLSDIQNVSSILITHIHPDHFEPTSILEAFGADIPLFMPEESVHVAEKAGFSNVIGMQTGKSIQQDHVVITATYSVDGFGTPQIAWIVEADGRKIIHCGDTLWHGYWWKIRQMHGPIDVACLPVNAPVLKVSGLDKQSAIEAAMSPEQAVEAAYLLDVNTMIPIHFGTFHNPPYYIETDNLIDRLLSRSRQYSLDVRMMKTGERLNVTDL
ncbi:MBL fold metallo-hydrolase [Melghirimyces algeriensis]|uniref:L-ascorbate metabolism protein UlaG, beta-lactamase superfamily n=1 Tax=Melghirimyces algeriensis TaxID=910412 RepID=A0A521CL85_9BACL|nr:MBL fold metallo-hydrolase [Melghirimyces algeriensis]SMO60206.1 L-ascorbate metabolism protein UlaG, beta-lactamase superfamily [Melghirimyces algeriensis]